MAKNKKSDVTNKDLMAPTSTASTRTQYSLSVSQEENEELKQLSNYLGCSDVKEFLSRSVELTKIVAKCRAKGYEVFLVDPIKAETICDKDTGKITISLDSSEAFIDVTNRVEEIINFQTFPKNTTIMFGNTSKQYEA